MSARGVVVYAGPSRIDPRVPIVAIATGLDAASGNRKTGAMVQTWILRADLLPTVAVATRADGAICGGCPHRRQRDGSRSCYVNVGQGPQAIYRAWQRGLYGHTWDAETFRGRRVRLGAYGDPAAVPGAVWAEVTRLAALHTGYTHQWRAPHLRDALQWCQASCDSVADVAEARALGARGTFRVRTPGTDALPGEIVCPASAEAGHTTVCAACGLCDGSRAAVVIDAHGTGATHVVRRALPVLELGV